MLRATLKSLLSRKLRLILSTVAASLGVAFVSGSLVLTDTLGRSFDQLFTDIYSQTEIEVSKASQLIDPTGMPVQPPMPASDVTRVSAVTGVKSARGAVFANGARVVGKNGKVPLGTGGPRYGASWIGEDALISLREGRAPATDTEVVLSASLVRQTGYKVGDRIDVLTPHGGRQTFTLVGITVYAGGRESLAGETIVYFTESVAQRLMLGEEGVYNLIDVRGDGSVALTELRDRIAAALGDGYQVKTGEELAADTAGSLKQALGFFNYLLLGFAGVALFVGMFLILNTFSITVAQRTRELALFRAMGASRGQVIRSVLLEAVLIGLTAAVIGLGLGIGIGAVLSVAGAAVLSGGELQLAGLGVPLSAVIAAFGTGVGVTVIAALTPAVRAARTPPVAAMRDATIPDRPLTALTVGGAATLVAGGVALWLAMTGRVDDIGLWVFLGGLIACLIGAALLAPILSRPVVATLGRLFSRGASGELGRRNSARNPRRTAITAAALMVSIALVTGISVIISSLRASQEQAIDVGFDGDIAIAADPLSGGIGAIDPKAMEQIRQLPGVSMAVSVSLDMVSIGGMPQFVAGIDDPAAAMPMLKLNTVAGSLSPIPAGSVIVDDRTAKARGLSVGSTVTVETARSGTRTFTVSGIYQAAPLIAAGYVFGPEDVASSFTSPAPIQGFVKVAAGTNVDSVLDAINNILANSPEVSAAKLDDFVAAQLQVFDFVLYFVLLLLLLATVVGVLGVINTLALSMIERTREIGLLRAVGMKRGQVVWMTTVESVVISVFGALLGIGVGVGLGSGVVHILGGEGLSKIALPWPLMVVYLVAAVIVGFLAAVIPAFLAARVDMLKAIAYE